MKTFLIALLLGCPLAVAAQDTSDSPPQDSVKSTAGNNIEKPTRRDCKPRASDRHRQGRSLRCRHPQPDR